MEQNHYILTNYNNNQQNINTNTYNNTVSLIELTPEQQQQIIQDMARKQSTKNHLNNSDSNNASSNNINDKKSNLKKTKRRRIASANGGRKVQFSNNITNTNNSAGFSNMNTGGSGNHKSKKNNSVMGSSFPAFFQKNFSADSPNVIYNAGSKNGDDAGRLRTTHKSFYKPVRRMIVIGDIHGDLDALIECLRIAQVISIPQGAELPADPSKRTSQVLYNLINRIRWTGSDTFVIQLGDQIDRIRPTDWHDNQVAKGETQWDEGSSIHIFYLLWYLNYMANKDGGRVISIIGNHEFMNMSGDFRYVSPGEYQEYSDAFRLFYQTRPPTYLANATAEINAEIAELEQIHPVPPGYLERRLSYAPGGIMSNFMALHYKVIIQVGSWVFSHAGLTRKTARIGTITAINNAVSRCLLGPRVSRSMDCGMYDQIINCRSEDSPVWTRVYGEASLHNNATSVNRQRAVMVDTIFKEYNQTNKKYLDASKIPMVKHMAVGHTPQGPQLGGINSGLGGRIWRCDVGMSRAFGSDAGKRIQVLEVLEDGAVVNVLRRS